MKHLRLLRLAALMALALSPFCLQAQMTRHAVEGRWDMMMNDEGVMRPSWLEIMHSGTHRLFGYFVGFGGSARPVSKIEVSGNRFSFTVPPQWEQEDNDFVIEGTLQGDSLVGTMIGADGKLRQWTAHRAPTLRPAAPVQWGKPIVLFNGKDLKGWHATGANQWEAKNGLLVNPRSGSNLVTDATFTDFKLHIEFRYPAGSNSGVYLRGRYEVQVEDSYGKEPQKDLLGAVYGLIKPSANVAKKPGEWQTYDITLTGRYVTIVANGKTIVCNQEIPGITGGALDSYEGKPGPIMLQGDHGEVEYRNITLTPALSRLVTR